MHFRQGGLWALRSPGIHYEIVLEGNDIVCQALWELNGKNLKKIKLDAGGKMKTILNPRKAQFVHFASFGGACWMDSISFQYRCSWELGVPRQNNFMKLIGFTSQIRCRSTCGNPNLHRFSTSGLCDIMNSNKCPHVQIRFEVANTQYFCLACSSEQNNQTKTTRACSRKKIRFSAILRYFLASCFHFTSPCISQLFLLGPYHTYLKRIVCYYIGYLV